MKLELWAIVLGVALITYGCVNAQTEPPKKLGPSGFPEGEAPPKPTGKPVSPSSKFLLKPEEAKKLESAAKDGDADAAFRLSLHYGIGMADTKNEAKWLGVAANLGHAEAQYKYAYYMVQVYEPRDLDGAEKLLAKAKVTAEKAKDHDSLKKISDLLLTISEMREKK